MFPPGTSMAGFGAQQWAAFAAMAGQPAVGNTQAFQLGGVDSNGVVLGAVGPGYLRLTSDSTQSSVMPGSSLHSTPNPYGSHPTLGYALQPSLDPSVPGRQVPSANIPPYLQHYPPNASASQTLPFPHVSIPYGQSYPYIQPLLPALCNGGLNQVQQCPTIPQQQAALVSGFEPGLRVFDSLKGFGTLPQEQNRRAKSLITSKTNLYISGLNESDTDESVRSLVGNIVTPKSCKAMMNNGVCKGYGFIDCATEEDAEKAKSYIMANASAAGRKLLVKFAHENEKDVYNVYVRHLPADFTKEKLEGLFRKYGEITSVKLLENEDRLTGIGFVRYAHAEQAERAIEQMNAEQLYLGGNTAPVMCKLADKPNARRRVINSTNTTSALMSLPLTTPVQRQSASFGTPTAQRIPAASLSQQSHHQQQQSQQQSNLAIPFTTQLISPLNQPQVILHNIQASAGSPHARAVLSPGVIANGSPSSLLPFIPPGGMALPCQTPAAVSSSTRATPLIGPPPQTATIPQSNQSTTGLMTASNLVSLAETPLTVTKSVVVNSPTSKPQQQLHSTNPSVSTDYTSDNLPAGGSDSFPSTIATSQGTVLIPSNGQPPTINSQLLMFSQNPSSCVIQNTGASVFPYFSCGGPLTSPRSSLPSSNAPSCTVGNQALTHLDSTVQLATCDKLQALSLQPQSETHPSSGVFHLTVSSDPLFCSTTTDVVRSSVDPHVISSGAVNAGEHESTTTGRPVSTSLVSYVSDHITSVVDSGGTGSLKPTSNSSVAATCSNVVSPILGGKPSNLNGEVNFQDDENDDECRHGSLGENASSDSAHVLSARPKNPN